MEVVLLWLDELDDLVTLSAAAIDRTRVACLKLGCLAALPIPLLDGRATGHAGALAVVAAAAVLVWAAALAARFRFARCMPARGAAA